MYGNGNDSANRVHCRTGSLETPRSSVWEATLSSLPYRQLRKADVTAAVVT